MSRRTNPNTPYATTGDRDPFTYGGGIIYVDDDGDALWNVWPFAEEDIPEPETDDEGNTILTNATTPVFSISVPADVWADHNWAKPRDVASSSGQSVAELKKLGKSSDPAQRASVLQDIAQYYGYDNLDSYPNRYTMKELLEIFEADHEKALRAEEQRRSGNPPRGRGHRHGASGRRSNARGVDDDLYALIKRDPQLKKKKQKIDERFRKRGDELPEIDAAYNKLVDEAVKVYLRDVSDDIDFSESIRSSTTQMLTNDYLDKLSRRNPSARRNAGRGTTARNPGGQHVSCGDLSAPQRRQLQHVYESSRGRGFSKQRSAQEAWSAVGRSMNPPSSQRFRAPVGLDVVWSPAHNAYAVIWGDGPIRDRQVVGLEMNPAVVQAFLDNPSGMRSRMANGAGWGAFLGSLAGIVLAAMTWSPLGLALSIAGGAVGGHYGAPSDRRQRGAVGGAIGGAVGPLFAGLGGWLGARHPDRKGNPKRAANPADCGCGCKGAKGGCRDEATIELRDKTSGNRVWLSMRDGVVVGAMGSEPDRYVGLTADEAKHLARHGGLRKAGRSRRGNPEQQALPAARNMNAIAARLANG